MGIFNFIGKIFKPAAELVDNLHTSDEERLELQKQLMEIQSQMQGKLIEYETKLMQAQSSAIQAEATGHSWLQRNWRPITMLTFLVLVVLDSLGIILDLNNGAWTLLQIGLGGYVVGRSAEKVVTQVKKTQNGSGAMG